MRIAPGQLATLSSSFAELGRERNGIFLTG